MIDWVDSLSIVPLVLVVCALMALVTVAIYLVVTRLAAAGRGDALAAVSPGFLPPMSLVFGLLVGFLAAGVWSNTSSAQQAVDNEASALRGWRGRVAVPTGLATVGVIVLVATVGATAATPLAGVQAGRDDVALSH